MRINIKDVELLPEFIRQKKADEVPKQSDEYLRDSLKNVGMKEPLTVIKLEGKYLLIDGYRRLKAIEQLGGIGELHDSIDITSLPAVVHEDISPMVARYMVDIRQDLLYSLRATYIKRLIDDHGKTRKDIAKLYGISPPSIENWLVILRCIPEVRKAIDKGQLPMSAGKIFSTIKDKGQQILYNRLKNYSKVTRDRINREAKRIAKSLFNIPDAQKRKRIAQSLIEKKTGYVHENRTELKVRKKMVMDDIVVAEKEYAYLERQVKFYTDTVHNYVSLVEIWFRWEDVKKYVVSNYSRSFSDISDVIYVELGRKV